MTEINRIQNISLAAQYYLKVAGDQLNKIYSSDVVQNKVTPFVQRISSGIQYCFGGASEQLNKIFSSHVYQHRVAPLLNRHQYTLAAVGSLAALVIVARYFWPSKPLGETWVPANRSQEEWMGIMSKNLTEAGESHSNAANVLYERHLQLSKSQANDINSSNFDTCQAKAQSFLKDRDMILQPQVVDLNSSPRLQSPNWKCFVPEKKKDTNAQLDFQFVENRGDYILTGFFHGIGSKEVAQYANENFSKYFQEESVTHSFPPDTLSRVVYKIQKEVEQKKEWDAKGTAAVLSYIDRANGIVYTCTIGNCEAFIYHNITTSQTQNLSQTSGFQTFMTIKTSVTPPSNLEQTEKKVIPLSPLRNWHVPQEEARVRNESRVHFNIDAAEERAVLATLDSKKHPKITVSRNIGCRIYRPSITCEPEFTIQRLEKGDQLVLSNKSLFDAVHHTEIAEVLSSKENLSQKLCELAAEKRTQSSTVVISLEAAT